MTPMLNTKINPSLWRNGSCNENNRGAGQRNTARSVVVLKPEVIASTNFAL